MWITIQETEVNFTHVKRYWIEGKSLQIKEVDNGIISFYFNSVKEANEEKLRIKTILYEKNK